MKNFTFLFTGLFLIGNTAFALEKPYTTPNHFKVTNAYIAIDYREAEPIQFTERGIEFFVFPTGEFDFNTRPDTGNNGDYYFRTAGKRAHAATDRPCADNYGVRIERDAFGRVRRVGNTFINYDAYDRVNRIGTVFMRYNTFALTQIGGMRIIYDRKGRIIDMFGTVKGYRNGFIHSYESPRNNSNSDYYYRSTPENKQNETDNDGMYYRKNEVKEEEKSSDIRK